jgi:hypothetical protein
MPSRPEIPEATMGFEDEDNQEFAVRIHERRIDKGHAGMPPESIDQCVHNQWTLEPCT